MAKFGYAFILFALLFTPQAHAAEALYIGDSHSFGCFGEEIDRTIRSKSSSLRSLATCGSGTWSWLKKDMNETSCGYRACSATGKCTKSLKGKGPSLSDLLDTEKPKLTVVALGTNMMKSNFEYTMPEAKQMIAQIKKSGSACVWIGAPQAATFFNPITAQDKYFELLRNTVESEGCLFISSHDKTARENLNDTMGLHYSCKHGTAWGKKVGDELRPILERTFSPKAQTPAEKAASKAATAVQ